MWHRTLLTINRILEYVTMGFLIIMVSIITIQIISRIVIGYSFSWTEELSRYLFIWIVFLGAGIGFRHGSHINIDFLVERMSGIKRKSIYVLGTVLCTLFILALIKYSIDLINGTLVQMSPTLNIPMGYIYSVIPISGVIMILNLIDSTIRTKVISQTERENR